MNILKNQYNTAKELLSIIQLLDSYHRTALKLKMDDNCFEDLFRNYNLFMMMMGNANVYHYTMPTVKNSALSFIFDCQEYFAQYEKELLGSGAIEYGDTLTDEQKLAYYHQQELQQLHQQEFECQY